MHDSRGLSGEPQNPRKPGDLAGFQDDVTGGREGADLLDHSHADIAFFQGAGIVQAVTNHHHGLARVPESADKGELVDWGLVEVEVAIETEQRLKNLPLAVVVAA